MKIFIFQNKKENTFMLYGSIKEIYSVNDNIIIKSKSYLYQSIDFELDDYEDNNCKIMKRTVIRSKQNIIA